MSKQLEEGMGWRLGWNPQSPTYKGLVGTEHWSLELTETEFKDFCRLTLQLADTMAAIATELMDEERITCEAESELLWLEADGFPSSYTLRLILLTGRRGEGEWQPTAVANLVRTIQTLDVY